MSKRASYQTTYQERYAKNWQNKKCARCSVEFKIGDKVHIKICGGGKHRNYHEACWESLFVG